MAFIRLYVLRVNRASGVAEIGWAGDLPLTHYEHIQTVGESVHCPKQPSHHGYDRYVRARRRMEAINRALRQKLQFMHEKSGHFAVKVPFHHGCYQACFAAIHERKVCRLEPCRLHNRNLSELEQAVYEQKTQIELAAVGTIKQGRVMEDHAGAWFIPV